VASYQETSRPRRPSEYLQGPTQSGFTAKTLPGLESAEDEKEREGRLWLKAKGKDIGRGYPRTKSAEDFTQINAVVKDKEEREI
jgi:hypothetical protein